MLSRHDMRSVDYYRRSAKLHTPVRRRSQKGYKVETFALDELSH